MSTTEQAGVGTGSAAGMPTPGPRGLRHFLKRLAVIAVVSYVGLGLYLYVGQSRLIYHPSREIESTPAERNLSYEDVRLPTADGGTVHGWFVPAGPAARGAVLFCHGNAGNIGDRVDSILFFHDLGFAVLIFDYRGYGQSPGRPSEKGTIADAVAGWDHLVRVRGVAPGRILIFGRSLGGSVAAHVARGRAAGGLILESAFTSVPDLGADLYPFLPVRLLSRFRYDTRACLAEVTCPVIVAHSPDDEMIPFRHGESLYAAAPAPKHMIRLQGGHNEGFFISMTEYAEALRPLLAEWFP